ncbi:MAG: tetratricopeptide repeat protein, partial [Anaerolineales bacterium]
MAQQGFEDTPLLTLEEIRTHHRQNQRDTLRLINTFLAHYPDDRVAQLLKVEICLAQKVSAAYPFVTRTLAQHFDDDDDLHTWADKLRRQRERLVRKSMKNGREYAGQKNLDDAIAAFEDAIALQPEDPGLYFAAGHALLSTFPEAAEGENRDSFFAGLFRRERLRESSLQRWHESVVAYLEGALRYAEAEDGLYQDAFAALARYCKAWNRVPAGFIAYWPEQADPALHDLRQLMVDHALDMAATLLRLHKPREASRLLNLARKVLPRHPALRLLLAEKHRQNERLDKAAIELGRAGGASDAPPDLDTEALSRLAAQLDKQQAPCPQCRKRSPLFDFTFKAPQRIHTHCPICGAALRVGDLWADAYDLTLADMPAAAYVARAELALHQDDIEAALPHLDDAEAALPPNHKGHLNIRMTRHNITQPQSGHTRQERLNAAIDRGVVDDSLLYFITQMNRQMPEGWADIPPQRRLKLCRMLLKGGHYLALQKLFPLAFADNPARKSVTQFAAQMDNTITTYVQAQREPAQKALRASRPEEAARLMTTVIELMPRLPELYLIRGEAHLQLQQDAPALDDFHHVLEYADDITLRDRAIKNIAVLLEQRWDLDGAQKMLGRVSTQDDETAQLYERIERRRAAMPYIRVKPADVTLAQDSVIATAGPPSHHALFAVAVREVSALHSPEAMNAVLSASFEFIQSLGNFRDVMHDVVFALRFIGWPYPEIPERGTIRVALLVRVTDGDAEVAQRRARRVYRDLLPSLPLSQDNIYVFEPVVDEAELDSLLMPFQSDDISQIVRRESTPEQDGIYAVAPFRVGTRDLHALMWTLLRQSAPAMVSLHLKPTHFYAWERQTHVSLPELPL